MALIFPALPKCLWDDPNCLEVVWLILIPAKLHNYYENSKGKKAPFQPITACDIRYDNSCTRYMKNFSCLHYTCTFYNLCLL